MYMNNNDISRSVMDILYIFIYIHFDKNDVNCLLEFYTQSNVKKLFYFCREDSNSTWKTSNSNQ